MIPEELQRFIRSAIKSGWALELLLLMRRSPQRTWTVDDLNRDLRGSLVLVTDTLTSLKQAGLVQSAGDDRYVYRPATEELGRSVQELEAAYAARPVAVMQAIMAAPHEKIQTFADAFRFKKN